MARVRHSVRWRPAGAALAFLLAAVAGVVGSQLTGDLTVALVVFVALLAAGMAVTFVLERHAERAAFLREIMTSARWGAWPRFVICGGCAACRSVTVTGS